MDLPVVPGQTVVQNCLYYTDFTKNRLGDLTRACAIYTEYCSGEAPPECRR